MSIPMLIYIEDCKYDSTLKTFKVDGDWVGIPRNSSHVPMHVQIRGKSGKIVSFERRTSERDMLTDTWLYLYESDRVPLSDGDIGGQYVTYKLIITIPHL